MKNPLTILLFLICLKVASQTLTFLSGRENHYGPFHQIIKDTTQGTISKFGHYFSISAGKGYLCGKSAFGQIVSYSLAYKSHLFSGTMASAIGGKQYTSGSGGGPPYNSNGGNPYHFSETYYGLLIGESLRFRHSLVSFSIGVAMSEVHPYRRYSSQSPSVSIPLEMKSFLLARNGIGFGLHFSENIMLQVPYSPFNF